jgi:MFS family permease
MLRKLLGKNGPLGVFVEYPVLLRLGLISACAEMAWATLILVMEYYFKDTLFKGQAAQLIASRVAIALLAFTICETVLKVPMGRLSDRIGPRKVVIVALLFALCSPLLMTFSTQWWMFIPLRAIDGFAAAALWPSMSALMARSVSRNAKAAAMSVFNGAYCLGLAVGPLAGLYLGNLFGTNRWVFPLASLMLAIGAFTAWRVLRGETGAPPPRELHGVTVAHQSLFKGHPMLRKMMGIYALSQTAVGILATTLPLYLADQFHIEQADLPRMIVLPAIILAVIALPLGRVADSVGRPRAVWLSYIFATVGMGLVAAVRVEWVFGIGMLFLAISYILGTPAWLGLTSLQVHDRQQAEALSMMQTAQGIGVVVGLGSVAAAGHLLTQWHKVKEVLSRHGMHLPKDLHLPERFHFQSFNTVPISVWLDVCVAVFALCLIGTLLWVREPPHPDSAEEEASSARQPIDLSGV